MMSSITLEVNVTSHEIKSEARQVITAFAPVGSVFSANLVPTASPTAAYTPNFNYTESGDAVVSIPVGHSPTEDGKYDLPYVLPPRGPEPLSGPTRTVILVIPNIRAISASELGGRNPSILLSNTCDPVVALPVAPAPSAPAGNAVAAAVEVEPKRQGKGPLNKKKRTAPTKLGAPPKVAPVTTPVSAPSLLQLTLPSSTNEALEMPTAALKAKSPKAGGRKRQALDPTSPDSALTAAGGVTFDRSLRSKAGPAGDLMALPDWKKGVGRRKSELSPPPSLLYSPPLLSSPSILSPPVCPPPPNTPAAIGITTVVPPASLIVSAGGSVASIPPVAPSLPAPAAAKPRNVKRTESKAGGKGKPKPLTGVAIGTSLFTTNAATARVNPAGRPKTLPPPPAALLSPPAPPLLLPSPPAPPPTVAAKKRSAPAPARAPPAAVVVEKSAAVAEPSDRSASKSAKRTKRPVTYTVAYRLACGMGLYYFLPADAPVHPRPPHGSSPLHTAMIRSLTAHGVPPVLEQAFPGFARTCVGISGMHLPVHQFVVKASSVERVSSKVELIGVPISSHERMLEVGTKIKARWKGGADSYPAHVTHVRILGDSLIYDLKYLEGDVELNVPERLVRRHKAGKPRGSKQAPAGPSSSPEASPDTRAPSGGEADVTPAPSVSVRPSPSPSLGNGDSVDPPALSSGPALPVATLDESEDVGTVPSGDAPSVGPALALHSEITEMNDSVEDKFGWKFRLQSVVDRLGPGGYVWTDPAAQSGGSGGAEDAACASATTDPVDACTLSSKDRTGTRLKASVKHVQFMKALALEGKDPLTMVECGSYSEVPGHLLFDAGRRARSDDSLEQPFKVRVMPEVHFLCDLHAHLARTEVIGFLGGTWNADSREVVICAAFPCRALEIDSDAKVNVEMDPASAIEARERIDSRNLRLVGWYHSHPSFQPDPSIRDIENQHSYQQLFKDPNGSVEPFVGIIVSPYDTRNMSNVSRINYFNVAQMGEGKSSCPMGLRMDADRYLQCRVASSGPPTELGSGVPAVAKFNIEKVFTHMLSEASNATSSGLIALTAPPLPPLPPALTAPVAAPPATIPVVPAPPPIPTPVPPPVPPPVLTPVIPFQIFLPVTSPSGPRPVITPPSFPSPRVWRSAPAHPLIPFPPFPFPPTVPVPADDEKLLLSLSTAVATMFNTRNISLMEETIRTVSTLGFAAQGSWTNFTLSFLHTPPPGVEISEEMKVVFKKLLQQHGVYPRPPDALGVAAAVAFHGMSPPPAPSLSPSSSSHPFLRPPPPSVPMLIPNPPIVPPSPSQSTAATPSSSPSTQPTLPSSPSHTTMLPPSSSSLPTSSSRPSLRNNNTSSRPVLPPFSTVPTSAPSSHPVLRSSNPPLPSHNPDSCLVEPPVASLEDSSPFSTASHENERSGEEEAVAFAALRRHLTLLIIQRYGPRMSTLIAHVVDLIEYYRLFKFRLSMSAPWKPGGVSRLLKLKDSLLSVAPRLPLPAADVGPFVDDIISYVRFSWDSAGMKLAPSTKSTPDSTVVDRAPAPAPIPRPTPPAKKARPSPGVGGSGRGRAASGKGRGGGKGRGAGGRGKHSLPPGSVPGVSGGLSLPTDAATLASPAAAAGTLASPIKLEAHAEAPMVIRLPSGVILHQDDEDEDDAMDFPTMMTVPSVSGDGEPDLAAAAVAVVAAAAAEVMDLPPAPIPPTPPPVVDSPIVLLNSEEEFLPTDADALMMQSLVDM